MYKLCKTEQSAKRQRELEYSLLNMMSTRYYDEISVSDLCDHIKLPRKSFYRYFSGKDGALHALLDHTLMELESYSYDHGGETRDYHRDMERFFTFWKEQKVLLDALQRSNLTGVLFDRCLLYAKTGEGIPNRFLPQNGKTQREYWLMFGVCGMMSLVTSWHHEGFAQSPWEMAQIATQLLTQPLFAEHNG